MSAKVCKVEFCSNSECPKCGEIQFRNKDGETERHPYCYGKDRQIPEEIATPGYEPFPDWCPLEDAS